MIVAQRCESQPKWMASSACLSSLEPDVSDATPIARQIFKTVKTIETLQRNPGHFVRLGQAKVDGNPGLAVL
jgi:hypothetical protein